MYVNEYGACLTKSVVFRDTEGKDKDYVTFDRPRHLNESEARARHIAYRVTRMPMAAVLRTRAISEPRGFVTMLIEEASDHILGFTALRRGSQ